MEQTLSPIIEVMKARYLLSHSLLTARVYTYDPDSNNQVHSPRTYNKTFLLQVIRDNGEFISVVVGQ